MHKDMIKQKHKLFLACMGGRTCAKALQDKLCLLQVNISFPFI